MLKKFVPLNSANSPSNNPYEVRTYLGDSNQSPEWKTEYCMSKRRCDAAPNSTISKVLTIEDELRRLHQKAKENRFRNSVKRRCQGYDQFTMCVVPQRTPQELREHAIMREKYLLTSYDMRTRVHDAAALQGKGELAPVQLNSPVQMDSGEEEEDEDAGEELDDLEEEEKKKEKVKPRYATPDCSIDIIYKPSQKLLELKRPKSGMFHNESEPPYVEDIGVDYNTYNPRLLQEDFDNQGLQKIDLIEGKDERDLWTWNIGVQKVESFLDRAYLEATIPKLDCENMKLFAYNIPQDMEKTFTAEMVFGTTAVERELPPRKSASQRHYFHIKEVACLYIAYVESFRLNPDFWTAETMDGILTAGDKLQKKSANINYKSPDTDFDILPQIPEKQAVIGLKAHFTGPLRNEPNIYKALSLYFSKFNAAILRAENLYLLIWRRCHNAFYVFDPNGRNELCQRDFDEGKCSLMATKFVEHLVHLIMNFSDADLDGEFHLYEIFLINYGKMTMTAPTKVFPKICRRLWAVVNATYAIIPGLNNGLYQPVSGNTANASMIISLIAMLYSDIEPAKDWRMETIDDLIKLGQAYYKVVARKCKLKNNQILNVVDLPEGFMLGPYRSNFKKRPFLYTGHVVECRNFLQSYLTLALKEFFSGRWAAALMQIDNSVIGIWRDTEYFYAFDPFRRGKAGQVLDPDDYLTKGVACLQMHTNFESFCRILYQKAIKMRRGSKFFLHGINIGCIKPIHDGPERRNRFKSLKLSITKYPEDVEKERGVSAKKSKKGKKIERSYSIHTIPSEDLIPEYEEEDVVDQVLEEILCDIFQMMEEPIPPHDSPYKQVKKVLLRSDKDYLDALKYNVLHNADYDNVYEAFRTQPPPPYKAISLENELQLPSNFEILPDGSWAIFGTTELPVVQDELIKLGGLLSGLITMVLSSKYNISTWNSDLIEFALESTNMFNETFTTYEGALSAVLNKKLPKISVGQNMYSLKIRKVIQSSMTRSLRQMLLESLMRYSRLLMVCQNFSCVIIKRYNFLYMFIGFPCTTVGYRKFGSGPACMLRFVELDALIRRIEFGCNPQGCKITNYVAVAFKVIDVTTEPPERFRDWPKYDQDAMYALAVERKKDREKRRMDKINFLDDELRKENARIRKFLDEKEGKKAAPKRPKKAKRRIRKRMSDYLIRGGEHGGDEFDMEGVEEEVEEEEEIELKHKPGKQLKKEIIDQFKPRPIVYGYRLREKDCLFKIQGSSGLENRAVMSLDEIKPCFFVSTLAILYATLRPLNQWTSQRIDRVVENGKAIAGKVSNMTTAFERVIKNVTVDEYEFDIWAKTYEPAGVWGSTVDRKIAKATQTRRYLMLQISNTTYAIYRDEYYHLFDPYPSMETADQADEDKKSDPEDAKKNKKLLKGIRVFGERNTASWVLFATVKDMLQYIDKRAANPDWREIDEYKFHVVDILSFKRAPAKTRILQLLTDLSVPMECRVSKHGGDESTICAHYENISWLDLENCLPIWSRLKRRNTSGRYRNMSMAKAKKYDTEIEGRLWSLWGNLHPLAPVFPPESRGKQYLACNVIACCACRLYPLAYWSPHLLDTIVISGDKYHRESLENIKVQDYEFSLEDLNLECTLENVKFVVHLEHVAFGKLYAQPSRQRMNLADALMYFFGHFQFGILQCQKRSLAIGRTMGHDGGYFMFDCQSQDQPLFPKGQGASYVLRMKHLQVLLYCIVVTLNVPFYNVQFTLHKVIMLREGAEVEESEEEEESEKETEAEEEMSDEA